jgi:phage shock protein C
MSSRTRTLYRSRNGLVFGVCRGIADYAEISTIWIRLGTIVAAMLTGFWPIFLIYLLAAIFLRPAPVIEFSNDDDWSFYQSYVADRRRALANLAERCKVLDRRTRRMEDIVTDREYDWDRRFRSSTKA